jgi:hypothetical protein
VARLDEIPGISLVSAYIILAVGAVSLGRSVDGRRIRQKSSDGPKQEVIDNFRALYLELDAGIRTLSTYKVQQAIDDRPREWETRPAGRSANTR